MRKLGSGICCKSAVFVALLVCSWTAAVQSAPANTGLEGYWAAQDSVILVEIVDDQLRGRLVAMVDAVYQKDEERGIPGQPRLDDLNPDHSLQSRPLAGLELFQNIQLDGSKWKGKIYDPGSGNTYSATVRLSRDGSELLMRGYIGISLLGRTVTYERIKACSSALRNMLEQFDLAEVCSRAPSSKDPQS